MYMNWNLDNFENQHIYKGSGRSLKPCIQKSGKWIGKMDRVGYSQTCPADSAPNAGISKMSKHQNDHKCQHQICFSCYQAIKYWNLKHAKISEISKFQNLENDKSQKRQKSEGSQTSQNFAKVSIPRMQGIQKSLKINISETTKGRIVQNCTQV